MEATEVFVGCLGTKGGNSHIKAFEGVGVMPRHSASSFLFLI